MAERVREDVGAEEDTRLGPRCRCLGPSRCGSWQRCARRPAAGCRRDRRRTCAASRPAAPGSTDRRCRAASRTARRAARLRSGCCKRCARRAVWPRCPAPGRYRRTARSCAPSRVRWQGCGDSQQRGGADPEPPLRHRAPALGRAAAAAPPAPTAGRNAPRTAPACRGQGRQRRSRQAGAPMRDDQQRANAKRQHQHDRIGRHAADEVGEAAHDEHEERRKACDLGRARQLAGEKACKGEGDQAGQRVQDEQRAQRIALEAIGLAGGEAAKALRHAWSSAATAATRAG